MVYQHFTLVPSMTAAENLVMARPDVPAVIDWGAERRRLESFMAKMPFRIPLDVPVAALAAGERQKAEILKQLFLKRRLLVLDEPAAEPRLLVRGLTTDGDRGRPGLAIDTLVVKPHEIVGIAGVSGNGQHDLVEVLGGQRQPSGGTIMVGGAPYAGRRDEAHR